MNKITTTLCAVALTILPQTGAAQEVTFGVGYVDFTSSGGEDGAVLDLEYRFRPFKERPVLSVSWGAVANLTDNGDLFVGAGLWGRWQLKNQWFADLSMMPGLYEEGANSNDLGLAFEIRSLAGLGYRFDSGSAISLAVSHKSNAGLGDSNPGANALLLRYHRSF